MRVRVNAGGKDHQPGANDSLIYHSIFGRIMGNTVRMRPRDADGIGIGDDITPQRSKAQQQATAWNDAWERDAHFAAETEETVSQSSKISIKVRSAGAQQAVQQEVENLQVQNGAAAGLAPPKTEPGDVDARLGRELPPAKVDLIDLENGSRAPGRIDKAAQESAQNAADTMQAKAQAATKGTNLVDVESERVKEVVPKAGSMELLGHEDHQDAAASGEGSSEVDEDQKPRRPMNAVGLVTAEKVKNRAANAARTAFEAWQERNRLPDVADDELNVPPPEPLRFNIDEPALLDEDMVEILLLEEEPVEQEAPPQTRSPDGAAPAGEVTAIDETTMKEEDLQEAVGLLTQLEAFKRETLGQEALLREKEEAILMERKRRYEAQQYRERIRKAKLHVYEMYLWRKDMMQDYKQQVEYMRSPEWDEIYSEKIRRYQSGNMTRGIVIPAGGVVLLNHAWATIKVLRDTLNCTLPIEIIYNGPREMDEWAVNKFQKSFKDVRCVNAGTIPLPKHGRQIEVDPSEIHDEEEREAAKVTHAMDGFVHKAFSVAYAASFDEVIMLDADNTPLKNPEVLFNSTEYREGGNLYWPDWWDAQGWLRPAAYSLFGITPPWTVEGGEGFRTAESGQMVLNRLWHADVLEWVWFLNSHPEAIYGTMYGDKDTFPLSFYLARKGDIYNQIPVPPGAVLDATPEEARGALMLQEPASVRFLHVAMLQHDPEGRIAFMHRTAEGKFFPNRDAFRRFHIFTVPLSPTRASFLLGGRNKHMGYEAYQIDLQKYRDCPVPDERLFLEMCNIDIESTRFPIPVQPLIDFPELVRVVDAIEEEFEWLRKRYKGTIVLG
ncbi:g7008 [Coccomyxa viridis]|uniref:G7008 protein n=1 Tax=Coccomyxa viridis TaxID=1274662 RepID=A0ABP1FXY9_9CHLO